MTKKIFLAATILAVAISLSNCDLTSAGEDEDEGTTGTTAAVVTNLGTMGDDLIPASLDYSQNSAAMSAFKSQDRGNPCEGTDLFGCQPILFQLYLELAQGIIDIMIDIISEIGEAMGEVPDGGSGTASWGNISVEYSKTTSTDYSIIMSVDSIPAGYVDVNGNIYTIKIDIENMPADETGGQTGQMQATATYTDANTWDVDFLVAGMACQEGDGRAPERIAIKVAKASGLWTGKAMLYNGVWLYYPGEPTCDIAPSDALSMNFYTDFVADDTAARVSVYMMQRDKNDLTDIEAFGMDNLATNFPGAMGGPNTSNYANPFCNPAGTLDARWDDDCTDYPTVSADAAPYGPATDWVVPSAFYTLPITIPDTIE